jgi:hypothetical protein
MDGAPGMNTRARRFVVFEPVQNEIGVDGSKGKVYMRPEKAFGEALKEIRHKHNLSQEQIGFESGYLHTQISLFENEQFRSAF